MKTIKPILLLIACALWEPALSQVRISGSTDLMILRSFKNDQRFWAVGQNIIVDWDFTSKGGAYASLSYSSYGKFTNELSATAKAATTSPQQISFDNNAQIRFEQISLGFKHYFVGSTDAEVNWNLYTITGFGLMFGRVTNDYSTSIDTSLYNAPQQPVNGKGHFKRLTLDLGVGWEIPLSADFYLYASGKVWIPTSDYPSKYLFVNDNAPLIAMFGIGVRILF